MAHPLGMSWGYQSWLLFAFEHTAVHQKIFKILLKHVTRMKIGKLRDWVPGHYTQNDDAFSLLLMAGHQLSNIRITIGACNHRWGALNLDLGKISTVFSLFQVLFTGLKHRTDGIRVDAALNMLYLIMMRVHGCQTRDGGNRNLKRWLPNQSWD